MSSNKSKDTENPKLWHYDSVGAFFNKYYEKLLTENMVSGSEMYIETAKDEHGSPYDMFRFLFPLKKDKLTYLIPTEYISKLPVMVTEYERVSYSGKGYRFATGLKPMKITPKKTMSFKELVDTFMNVGHTNPEHDTLWRLISIVAFIDRINVRVATNPEFGKDSKLNIINSLTGEIGKISNPTIAKLEYLLFNKVCFINEVAGINSNSKQDVEQFILQCGDFNNEYNKRSRASAGSSEKYDISKMSLIIAYNDLGQYTNDNKFFDFMWTNTGAINNRILPFLFNGKIKGNFNESFDADKTAKDNWDFYVNFMRALLYYKENNVTKSKYKSPELDFSSERWERNFNIISKWLMEYCSSQEEFNSQVMKLYKSHIDYQKMIGKTSSTPQEESLSSPLEESIGRSDKDRVLAYLEKYDKGEGIDIDTVISGCLVQEETIQKMKTRGEIIEINTGRIQVLK